jgi:hypothetical protein
MKKLSAKPGSFGHFDAHGSAFARMIYKKIFLKTHFAYRNVYRVKYF